MKASSKHIKAMKDLLALFIHQQMDFYERRFVLHKTHELKRDILLRMCNNGAAASLNKALECEECRDHYKSNGWSEDVQKTMDRLSMEHRRRSSILSECSSIIKENGVPEEVSVDDITLRVPYSWEPD